jgi:hypothetical protein
MHTRSSAAATALLLTASAAGLALSSGSAQATGSHVSHRAATKLVITIKDTGTSVSLSDSRIRPGNTIFKIKAHGQGSSGLQVVRLVDGYTLTDAFTDLNAAFGGDVPSIKRVDRNIKFYGGNQMNPKGAGPTFWGVRLDKAGTYYVLDIDSNALTTLKVKGTKQKRALPASDGWINMATASDGVSNVFRVGKNNPKAGWMSSTNNAKEPHFVDVGHVKKSTTRADVVSYFTDPAAPETPPFAAADGAFAAAGVISPGKTMIWSYSLPRGRYLVDCFWPSKIDGTPHAIMGMFKLFQLK